MVDDDWNDELSAEVRRAAEDPQVLAQVRQIFQRNSRHEDGAKRYLEDGEAETLARRVLAELLDPDGFRLADVGGLRFYLQLGDETCPGPNEILANAWDTNQWRPIGRVPLGDGEAP